MEYPNSLLDKMDKVTVFTHQLIFSRPDLNGNTPAKGKCILGKTRNKEVLSSSTKGHKFYKNLTLALKMLRNTISTHSPKLMSLYKIQIFLKNWKREKGPLSYFALAAWTSTFIPSLL